MRSLMRGLFGWCILMLIGLYSYGQVDDEFSSALDSARALEDNKKDSVVFSAKYVRYATLDMLKHASYTQQIDTSHRNFQYYNKQNLPWNPSIHLGSYGLATRDLLFTPDKSIGFQPGFHALERYLILPDSVRYYRARARYSELYAVGFFFDDQVFRARLAQNINPQWNIAAEYHAANTDGFYYNQAYSDRKGSVSTWYESKSRRYNLLMNATFNKVDASENGSVTNDTTSIFEGEIQSPFSIQTKLRGQQQNRPFNKWLDNGVFLRQSFYLGRLDTVHAGKPEMEIHPTNAFAHNTSIRQRKYIFFKNEEDLYSAFPFGDAVEVHDTTKVTNISNEFTYTFYLRNKSLKNEAKVNVGFQNDLIWYADNLTRDFFQNNAVKGDIRYQFSDKVDVAVSGHQIVVGENFGDYLYEATADVGMGQKIGKVTLGAYTQNKSPEMVFTRMNYTYHQWLRNDLNKTKTQNLSFRYKNDKLGFSGKAEYFLINNYLYFREVDNPNDNERLDRLIEPAQSGNLNLLKVTVGQNFKFGNFHLDNLVVYQKSDQMDILSTPELYTWHSFYYQDIWFDKVLDFAIGLDGKFNTPFKAPTYAINAGQFYNSNVDIEFSTYPVLDAWFTTNIKRVNLFISYNFLNQNFYPRGYYTVRRYPMNPANFRFGVSWKFYD
ncbi:putative porin [Sphingobacterium sp. SGG-5]|nr:putative porin [Sphingobacterium sp. SGG-5]